MDKELNCDFYFGHSVFMNLKKMDYSILKGYRRELKTIHLRSYKWQLGIFKVILKKYDSYIITGDPSYLSNWILLFFCNIRHKKLFLWCHGLNEEKSNVINFILKNFYKNATGGLLLYGNYSRNFMINKGYTSSKLYVIFNSLDHDNQFKIRQNLAPIDIYEKHFKNIDPVIIFIGRLLKEKRLEFIIESQKLLIKQGISCNVVFIGAGEMEESLKTQTRYHELVDRIWFYGSCYEEQLIAPLIFNASLTVSPGNIGLTAIHSLVYGTPVITHSNFKKHGPEFEAIHSGETGDFFEEGNVIDLTLKLSSWIKFSHNNRESIRKLCYKIIDSYYNPEYQIKLLKNILK
jgi:glycosyltransferase involved in cell wall biosynthesis